LKQSTKKKKIEGKERKHLLHSPISRGKEGEKKKKDPQPQKKKKRKGGKE